jgi:hypothetical protein
MRATATKQSSTPTEALKATVARIFTAIGRLANQPDRRRADGEADVVMLEDS